MLTSKELEQIQLLQIICENDDHISLKLNWDMLKNRDYSIKTDFFYYDRDILVGFAAIYGFGSEAEVCGMVHPDFRRRGIFSGLLNEAKPYLKRYQSVLLNAPGNSESAKSYIAAKGHTYSFTEHQMKRKHIDLKDGRNDIQLRRAVQSDMSTINEIDHLCFGITREDAALANQKIFSSDQDITYIITSKNDPVGKIRIQTEETKSWIYGFAVHPSFQGKGIGRAALSACVSSLNKKGADSIHLDVVATNKNALKLYESCGFIAYDTQDYYQYSFI